MCMFAIAPTLVVMKASPSKMGLLQRAQGGPAIGSLQRGAAGVATTGGGMITGGGFGMETGTVDVVAAGGTSLRPNAYFKN